jgi:hypothetical protein
VCTESAWRWCEFQLTQLNTQSSYAKACCRSDAIIQEQNRRLRIELLALRRAARVAGVELSSNSTLLLGLPPASLGLTDEGEGAIEGLHAETEEARAAGTALGDEATPSPPLPRPAPRKAGRVG